MRALYYFIINHKDKFNYQNVEQHAIRESQDERRQDNRLHTGKPKSTAMEEGREKLGFREAVKSSGRKKLERCEIIFSFKFSTCFSPTIKDGFLGEI